MLVILNGVICVTILTMTIWLFTMELLSLEFHARKDMTYLTLMLLVAVTSYVSASIVLKGKHWIIAAANLAFTGGAMTFIGNFWMFYLPT